MGFAARATVPPISSTVSQCDVGQFPSSSKLARSHVAPRVHPKSPPSSALASSPSNAASRTFSVSFEVENDEHAHIHEATPPAAATTERRTTRISPSVRAAPRGGYPPLHS